MTEKVIVTGGSGRLGGHVMTALRAGHGATALDIKPPPGDVPFIATDILDLPGLTRAFTGQAAVIHLAGYDDGDGPNEQAYMATNVQGAWNVFQAAEDAGVPHVVVASSTAALGLDHDRAPDYLPVDETHALRTTGTYGLGKQLMETMGRHYAARGKMHVICLRPTLIVRPEKEAQILAQLALPDPDSNSEAAPRNGVAPYGALSATRTYVRSTDAARSFVAALNYRDRPFDVFNLAAPDGMGRPETLARMSAVYETMPMLRDRQLYEADPCASVLDVRHARDDLGWQADGDWRDVVAWHHAKATTEPSS
jgi:nucleoside-diphosphate-sugar epimerase